MLKQKLLHRPVYNSPKQREWNSKHKKTFDFFDDRSPSRESIKPRKYYHKNHWNDVDTTPLKNFLEKKSETAEYWDDVYSEILTKIKPKKRWLIDRAIEWYVDFPLYDEEYKPRLCSGFHNWRLPREGRLFVDYYGRLVKSTTEDIEYFSKLCIRRDKLLQIEKISE